MQEHELIKKIIITSIWYFKLIIHISTKKKKYIKISKLIKNYNIMMLYVYFYNFKNSFFYSVYVL